MGSQTPGLLRLRATDGTEFRIRYHRERGRFELGRIFVGDDIVTTLVDRAHADLFPNALATIGRLPCADARMAAEVRRCLPGSSAVSKSVPGPVLVVRKTPDLLPLREVLDHYDGRLDPRHNGLDRQLAAQPGLLPRPCRHRPQRHFGRNLLHLTANAQAAPCSAVGGMRSGLGEPLRAAPAATIQYAPFDVATHRQGASPHRPGVDRALGRELLGDITQATTGA